MPSLSSPGVRADEDREYQPMSQPRRTLPERLRRLVSRPEFKVAMAVLSVLCAAPSDCGGGGGGGLATSDYVIPDQTSQNLLSSDVVTILGQAISEAAARAKPATIAVVDRLGNVLAVVQMVGAPACVTINSERGVATGLENPAHVTPCAALTPLAPTPPTPGSVPSTLAAIAKAVTGAFLSSGGNAFSTRTASQIIQEHFNPGIAGTPGGPLFGVQFSSLPCSDFNAFLTRPDPGPQRSPLGLAADPGGLPIYKQGVLVGGIGVISKPLYSLDLNVFDFDQDTPAGDDNEIIALAGEFGYGAPGPIQAQNISAGGVTLRYVDASSANFAAAVVTATDPYPAGNSAAATPVTVPGYYTIGAAPGTGVTWGTAASGVFPDGTGPGGVPAQYPVVGGTAWTFIDPATHVERVPSAGLAAEPGATVITAPEAQMLVTTGLDVSFETRGQIRIPTGSAAQVSVTVVDLHGNILAQARSPDAPVFGADVSVQKARSVVYFSRPNADPHSAFTDITNITVPPIPPSTATLGAPYIGKFSDYVNAVSLGDPSLFDSGVAFSDRALGDLAQPFYPEGIDGAPPGPLSLPFANWSPFSTGLQLDLVIDDIATDGLGGANPPAAGCANAGGVAGAGLPTSGDAINRTPLADGLQIFPGGEPLYRNGILVGAVGVSGDGVEQDDMVSYLAIENLAGLNGLENAPSAIRADQLSPGGAPLSYIICPFAPFLNSRIQNAC
jgi:uncharacterized protein GlcG (DUF336 family)